MIQIPRDFYLMQGFSIPHEGQFGTGLVFLPQDMGEAKKCEEILVQDSGSWPDYVFADDYDLLPLKEVEAHIDANKRLPGIPSAELVAEEGISVGAMQKRMMEKIEELTLYVIDQNKRLATQEDHIRQLQTELALQEAR